jgi:hypothetical protein
VHTTTFIHFVLLSAKLRSSMKLYFQGDLCIEPIADVDEIAGRLPRASDGAVVLAEGEATGHRHAFHGGGVALFRDDGLARDVPPNLFIGILKVDAPTAALEHEEHDTIVLPRGTYRIRRQREFEGSDILSETVSGPGRSRLVLD